MRGKGGVEGEIGRFRRHFLVPVPAVGSLAALNQLVAAADILDDGQGSPSRSMSRSIRWTRTSRPAVKTKDGGMVVAVTVMATINSSTILATPGANGVSAVTQSIRRFASPRVPGSGATRSSRRHGPISARTTANCEDTGLSPAAAARI